MQTMSKKGRRYGSAAAARDTLSKSGVRVTTQRALILQIVRQAGVHLDAGEIHQRARLKKPRLSLSTVYRTLRALGRLGLIDSVRIDDARHFYEAKQPSDHHHLICLECGQVIEFEYPLGHQMNKAIPAAKGFKIAATEIRVTGYCLRCQRVRQRAVDGGAGEDRDHNHNGHRE